MSILGDRFARLLVTHVLSSAGDAMLAISFMWLALQVGGSAGAAGGVLAIQGLPALLLGPLAGVWVDRLPKRVIMLSSLLLRAAVMGAICLLLLSQSIRLWHIVLAAPIISLAGLVYTPALRILTRLILPDSRLPAANSAIQVAQQLAQIGGSSVGGVAVSLFGAEVVNGSIAAVFLLATSLLFFLRLAETAASSGADKPSFWRELSEGISYLAREGEVVFLSALAVVTSLVLAPANIMLPVFSKEQLAAGATGFGLMEAAIAAGMLLGGVGSGLMGDRVSHRWSMAGSLMGMGLAFYGLSISLSLTPAVTSTVVLGMAVPFLQVPLATRMQRAVAPGLQGRVFATVNTASRAAVPLGALMAGGMLTRVSPGNIFMAVAVGLAALGLLWLWASRAWTYRPNVSA